MTKTRSVALRAPIENAGTAWEAAWTLTHAASLTAAKTAESLPLVDAVPLLLASADLRAAEDYLEQTHRDLPAGCAAADVGSADVRCDAASARRAVEQLVCAALEPVRHLRSSHPTGVASVDLASANALLCSARRRLLGSRP